MLAGLFEFLQDYPGMTLAPVIGDLTVIRGTFSFTAETQGQPKISDMYELRIEVPRSFPRALPCVFEEGRKIPRIPTFHINSDDSLCLGSPLRLLWNLSQKPSMIGFASDCLVPYLYAVSHKMKFGSKFVFSELEHGVPGMLEDYADMFSLKTPEQAISILAVLSLKKRRANKRRCPCRCAKRLGKCKFNYKIREFRKIASRAWYKAQLLHLTINK